MAKRNFLLIFFAFFYVSMHAQSGFEGIKKINGTELYCSVMGKGDPILIIHGGPGLNHDYFLPWLKELSKKHTLIFYDQRSAGKSALSIKQYMNFSQFAADIDSIRTAFGYEKITVFGHAWGGLLGVYYAEHYKQHVQSLILCGSIPLSHEFDYQMEQNQLSKFSSADSLQKMNIMRTDDFKAGKTAAVLPLMKLDFKTAFCDTANISRLNLNIPETYMLASYSYFGFMKELNSYNFFPSLDSIAVPVLIMHGKCDNIPFEADEKLHKRINNSTLIIFDRSGNFPFIEENKKFVKEINSFCKKNGHS